jgi:hypothetical protein
MSADGSGNSVGEGASKVKVTCRSLESPPVTKTLSWK